MITTPSRALVTGATGFVGNRLANLLVERNWEVHLIVRRSSVNSLLDDTDFTIHVDDGITPLHEIVDSAAPDVCFHTAGYFVGTHDDEDIPRLIGDNLLFGTRLADAIAKHGLAHYFVNCGTFWQNAGGRAYHPVALYAATKQAFQDILQFYAESGQLRVANLKLFDTYGPNDRRRKLLSQLLESAATEQPIGLSQGYQLLDLVHVDDVAAACLAALYPIRIESLPRFQSYAVTSGRPLQVRELVDLVSRVVGRAVSVDWGAREYKWREMMEPWDIAPALPDWSPKIGIEDGVRAMWQAIHEEQ